jgi:hypothetical protein
MTLAGGLPRTTPPIEKLLSHTNQPDPHCMASPSNQSLWI